MPKILIIDTYYPDFLRTLPPLTGTYEQELQKLLATGFGTSDFYSHALRAEGWEVQDVIANHDHLQHLWAKSDKWSLRAIALQQIDAFRPDVLFLQDLSFFDPSTLRMLSERYVLAGQCSCPQPSREHLNKFAVIFSSFPHYVGTLTRIGLRAEYLPLAFDPRMLGEPVKRDLDVSFVGGVGKQSHWSAGTDALEAVAATFGNRFAWYGYGLENLDTSSPLRKCWRGFAWGKAMYSVYARSRIVINRHGEVAQGFANNLRMYEATGMGALLLTEAAPNLEELFPRGTCATYSDAAELTEKVQYYLDHEQERAIIAQTGQEHTLSVHTYQERMKRVSEVLQECLEQRKVSA